MRALVVDDSRAMRSLLRSRLTMLGFEVVEAADGRRALKELEEAGEFDLVLLDWNLPELEGIEVARALRAEPRHRDVRVVMVTTEIDHARVMEALKAGVDEYLMKPFTAGMLEEKLELLGLRRS